MLRVLRLIALPAALALAACGSVGSTEPGPSADGVDMRGSSVGGEFTLTNQDGEKTSWSDFDGQYRLVYFGFTSCPAICPTDVLKMSQGLEQFEEAHPDLAGKVQPIFISVDPERDDPAALKQFVANFHPRLIGLTGEPDTIKQVATSFGGSAQALEPDEDGFYDMQHSTFVTLFGPAGEPLGILPSDKGADAIAAELAGWVR